MKTVFLLLFMPLLLSCNIGWTNDGTSVTIRNNMNKPVVLCDFSPLKDGDAPAFPCEVAADSECMFETGCSPEQYTFAVVIDGKRYESETRYKKVFC